MINIIGKDKQCVQINFMLNRQKFKNLLDRSLATQVTSNSGSTLYRPYVLYKTKEYQKNYFITFRFLNDLIILRHS